MKTSKQMSEELLKRRDEYNHQKAVQRKNMTMAAGALSIVLCVGLMINNQTRFNEKTSPDTDKHMVTITNDAVTYGSLSEMEDSTGIHMEDPKGVNSFNSVINGLDPSEVNIASCCFESDGFFDYRASSSTADISGVYFEDGLITEKYPANGTIVDMGDNSYWVGWYNEGTQYSLYGYETTLDNFKSVYERLK